MARKTYSPQEYFNSSKRNTTKKNSVAYTVTETQGPRNNEVRHLGNFFITKTTKDKVPTLPFFALKEATLGKGYDLSLVFSGDKRSQSLNRLYRNKTYIPNVLSFPLSEHAGEIFLNLKQASREHRARGESYEYFVALLAIHGMLHLKGMKHGGTMEEKEKLLLSKFHIENTLA